MDEVMAAYKKKYPSIPDVQPSPNPDNAHPFMTKDPNLEFDDEAEAYNKFRSHGFFTPNPDAGWLLLDIDLFINAFNMKGISK